MDEENSECDAVWHAFNLQQRSRIIKNDHLQWVHDKVANDKENLWSRLKKLDAELATAKSCVYNKKSKHR